MDACCIPLIIAPEPTNAELINSLLTHINEVIRILEKRDKKTNKTHKMLKDIQELTITQYMNIINDEIYPMK